MFTGPLFTTATNLDTTHTSMGRRTGNASADHPHISELFGSNAGATDICSYVGESQPRQAARKKPDKGRSPFPVTP